MTVLEVRRLGRLSYAEGLELQARIGFQDEIVEFGALDVHDRFHCS